MKILVIENGSKRLIWLTYDNGEVIFGAESVKDLKEHFKNSLKIDDDLKVTVIDHDRFLSDRTFT